MKKILAGIFVFSLLGLGTILPIYAAKPSTKPNASTPNYSHPGDEECKKDAWMNYGGMFKNQGDCVSYYRSNRTDKPDSYPESFPSEE